MSYSLKHLNIIICDCYIKSDIGYTWYSVFLAEDIIVFHIYTKENY